MNFKSKGTNLYKRRGFEGLSHSRSESSLVELSSDSKLPNDSRPQTPVPVQHEPQPLLSELPISKKLRDWWIRFVFTFIMLASFFLIVTSGHFWVILMVVVIQTLVFKEIIAICHVPSKEKKLPWFRVINWYFLFATNYYAYGESLFTHFQQNVLLDTFFRPFALYHRFLSFCFYTLGIVIFVMNLKKGHYRFQFLQFFWTHMTLLIVIFQAHFIIKNILNGLIWFLLPVSFVICNDIMAYMFGLCFGRTRLIALSPKKTWEGFIGGFISTVLFSVVISQYLMEDPYFICPATNFTTSIWSESSCQVNLVFVPIPITLPTELSGLLSYFFGIKRKTLMIAPLQWHSLLMATFASIIAPFGGFFASGFKRAFKLKDFGDSIPGHGGITDRMDCQFLMGTYSFMYYNSFIQLWPSTVSVASILQLIISHLNHEEQLNLYNSLKEYLETKDLKDHIIRNV